MTSDKINPLLQFCEMHHDKLIEGGNKFGPTGVRAFLWSQIKTPDYYYPFPASKTSWTGLTPIEFNSSGLILQRVPGESHGYFLYVLK